VAERRERHDDREGDPAAEIRRDLRPIGESTHRGQQEKDSEQQPEQDRNDAHESPGL